MSESSSIGSLNESEREFFCDNNWSETDVTARTKEEGTSTFLDDAENTDTSDEEVLETQWCCTFKK